MKIKIEDDKAGSECAACRSMQGPCAMHTVSGYRLVLCIDALKCGKRYRRGLAPAGYARALRDGSAPL